MAAPVWQSSTGITAASAASCVYTLPASIAADDVVVLELYKENTASTTPPAGFAQLTSVATSNPHELRIYWMRMAGGESGTVTVSWTGSTWRTGRAHRISGCVTSGDPWGTDFTTAFNNTPSNTCPAISLASTPTDSLLFWGAGNFGVSAVWTPPTGFTDRGQDFQLGSGTKDNTAGGATGTLTGSATSSETMTAFLGALSSAGGPPPAPRTSLPVSFVASSAWVAPASSATVTPTYPAGLAEFDVVYADLVIKPDTATVATPTDWTAVAATAVGGGTQGAGTGAIKHHLFRQVVPSGGLSGSQAFTITGGSSPVGCMRAFRYTNTDGLPDPEWDVETVTSYSRTTGSTTFGGTGAADLVLAASNAMVYVSGSADDQSSTHTISALAATGATLDTVTQDPTGTIVNAQGNDISAASAYVLVTAGPSSAAPSSTVTGSTSETGGGVFYRVQASAEVPIMSRRPIVAPSLAAIQAASW